MLTPVCRGCRARAGELVLDLGVQPACDDFPPAGARGPDPTHPLRMWLCANCGLAQLVEDSTTPAEPRAVEPAALVAQAADAVARVAAAGLLPEGASAAEYGSPHGGSWLSLLAGRGLRPVDGDAAADVVVDCFGLMHEADQAEALAARAARLRPGGVLLLQYHSLASIVRHGQWNALRHGHFAYYSTPTVVDLLTAAGLTARTAWRFDLYGGTVLVAAAREGAPDDWLRALVAEENAAGVRDPVVVRGLQHTAERSAAALRDWLVRAAAEGRTVLGYGAASRAVALLCRAGVGPDLLPSIADASPAKQGRRMPGSGIPVISPADLLAEDPDEVLLFLPDLLDEVRAALPSLTARWVVGEPEPRVV
ncbi:transferase [Solihabitans fulvus]|uniref:Transferase n=1 Tax=Solihabitans fulvus TaxID=1892852 RepID=A0A5B2XDD0_9PSEU|nr:methyltransferase C-terminal domain-containing protein [Solihabitans fulvus]KAA2261184.1 transferase [Solihabitans fulvus]